MPKNSGQITKTTAARYALLSILILLHAYSLLVVWQHLNKIETQITKTYEMDRAALQYSGLDHQFTASEQKVLDIYHVTKEYGEATYGGLGVVVTGLSRYQAELNGITQRINIVMPYYSFMKQKYQNQVTLTDILSFQLNDKTKVLVKVFILPLKSLNILFVSPGSVAPFSHAYAATKGSQIYNQHPYLNNDLKDILFAKSVAVFLNRRITPKDNAVVQLHGATNGLVVKFLSDQECFHIKSLYTMHDYYYEVRYSLNPVDINLFLSNPISTQSPKFYPSIYAIETSNYVNIVSETVAKDFVEGKLAFDYQDLISEQLFNRAKQNNLFGISNGIDLNYINPFIDRTLKKLKLNYPSHARNGLEITEIKENAKNYLIENDILSSKCRNSLLFTYIGKFQEAKGAKFLPIASQTLENLNVCFLIMGQQHDFENDKIEALKSQEHVTIISSEAIQDEFGSIVRVATDILFVPSLNEAFGLIAAEGLLFGSLILSTGAGGLKEYLKPYIIKPSKSTLMNQAIPFEFLDESTTRLKISKQVYSSSLSDYFNYNSFLFDPDSYTNLAVVINQAVELTKNMMPVERENLARKLILDALKLSWDYDNGPISKYNAIYDLMLNS